MSAATIPAGPRLPRPLQTLGWVTRVGPFLERSQARYGDVFSLKIANEGTWAILSHPDAIKQAFTMSPKIGHAGEGNQILGPVLGSHSVLLLDEDEHMSQRKLLLPAFHGERMQRQADLMEQVARDEIARWPTGTPFELRVPMQAVTLEVIMRAVFGLREGERLDALRVRLAELLDALGDPPAMLTAALLGSHVRKHPGFRRVIDGVDEILYAEIRERRHAPDLADRDDVLSVLLEARHEDGSPMADEELRDELMTLLVAGHETTATALSWAMERLLRNPTALERLADGDDEYADAVCKETLRLRPIIPIVARKLTEDYEIGGQVIPKGITLAPCIYLVHRRPEVYPEPRAFRPERFLGPDKQGGTYTWIPFGGGVRRCLGAAFAMFEMRIVLQTLVREAKLAPVRPESERIRRRAITLVPQHGTEVVAA